ncbi:MAG: mycofactocin-coupled SDR family oxidoreductase [Solirubrobacteraceae bacterium]
MARMDGKVAFITGAAGGMGRTHATRLADDGCDIIAVDIGRQLEDVPYAMPAADKLEETAQLVRERGRRAVTVTADIRDTAALEAAVRHGVAELGRLDVVVANAGIWTLGGNLWEIPEERFREMIEINLTSQWRTVKATIPVMLELGNGGSVIFIGSTNSFKAVPGNGHYTAAKHGVIGIMRTLAQELAAQGIRVNAVCPTGVNTDMLINDRMFQLFRPDLDDPGYEDAEEGLRGLNLIPVPTVEPEDVSDAVAWLASSESRMVTGSAIAVDAGNLARP